LSAPVRLPLRLRGGTALSGFPWLRGWLRAPLPDPNQPSRLIREPDFWRLWFVGLVMFVVRWIDTIVIAVFVYQSTGSAFLVALVTMLRMLPMGLFGVLFGSLADKFERRTSLIFLVLVSLLMSVILTLLAYTGLLTVWHLAVASFINGVAWAADQPVRRIMIGDVVGMERVNTAMSIDAGSNIASRMAGPTAGGIILAAAGIHGAFLLDVILYLFSLAAVFGITYRNRVAPPATANLLASLSEGLQLVRRNERLRGILVITLIFNLFAWPFTSMIPVIGQDNLHLAADGIGMLAGVEGVGAFCGALAIGFLSMPKHYPYIYVGGTILYLSVMCLYALAPDPLWAGAALLAVGLGGAGFAILQSTLVYLSVGAEMRGRALGVLVTCIGIGPLGFVVIGLLAEALGATRATIITAAIGLTALVATQRHWRIMWREQPKA
jgi:MFS family permease